MKIGIYSPYLDTYGGGERYILTIAECLADYYHVDLLLDKHLISLGPNFLKQSLSDKLNIDLSKVNVVSAPLGKEGKFWDRIFFLKQYDYLFYLTDGSIFYSTARNSIIHFQVPFDNINVSLYGKIKLASWKKAIFNSYFTKEIIEKKWPIKGVVIYPPIDIDSFRPLKKKKNILSVGRFFDFLHSKKQEILVQTFAKLVKSGLKGWTLQLAGGANEEGYEYIKKIKKLSQNLPVEFFIDATFDKLQSLYGEASIYWHAAGFGESDPKKMEHFGITTVEAMAAGCVPVVTSLGGQKEIVQHQQSGFLWNTTEEMENFTTALIDNPSKLQKFSQAAQKQSKIFSKENFCSKIKKLIDENY